MLLPQGGNCNLQHAIRTISDENPPETGSFHAKCKKKPPAGFPQAAFEKAKVEP
jgi:hypothetical protein